ncbi:uncharacterized mitochondrial protein AtMg00810-like [Beta vulgaris subsp. vulgaris]|uniref:uncharacterized mitochondrial protein AtMg00810-like n=1 Tax=Beta vulgaris subsp. vulgaris TaxID=3555 RepID=UPI000900735C|nr:uncharacterized mitochondrial protein AtMg00810-like [Beta vulgaris subsp. vulgaris]
MATVRGFIALSASRNWDLWQLDVNNAFLHGDLYEEVYMKMPEGIPNPSNQHLDHVFSIKDIGKLSFFLGIEIAYTSEGITLTQHKFTKELLQAAGISTPKQVATPLPLHLTLSIDSGVPFSDATLNRCLVGKINFITNTRPNLSYTVQTLSQYMHAPTVSHYQALLHALNYVGCTSGHGILLKASTSISLQDFSNNDWRACSDIRRSISGYLVQLGQSPISWKSKKQATMSKSSSEAEYKALASAVSEVTWMIRLLEELGVTKMQPVTLRCDNQSALHIAKNPVFHE